jgi:hypothetical protein
MLLLTFPTFGARSPLQPAPSVTLGHIYSTLLNPLDPISSEQQQARARALLEVAKLNRLVFQQALAGDPNCGYFLAELLAFISKNLELLRRKNEGFRRFNADWRRARATTSKQPALRKLIHEVLSEAELRRYCFSLRKFIPIPPERIKSDKLLSDLPDLDPSSEVVRKWIDIVVYPHLRSIKSQLRDDPRIGNMKKALDRNGKFQVSRLKPVATKIVARLAALPRSFYFDIS